MSSRSKGVTKDELIFLYSSCVIASLSCSTSTSRSLTDSTSASGSTSSDSSAVPFTRFSAARLKKSKNVSSLGRSLIRTGTPHAGPEPVEGIVVHPLALPPLPRHQLVYPDHQHVLVVRAVEHPHVSRRGQRAADPPQEVVPALLVGRRPEAHDAQPLRVHRPGDPAGRAVLPAAVHRLEDEQHPLPAGAGLRGRVQ